MKGPRQLGISWSAQSPASRVPLVEIGTVVSFAKTPLGGVSAKAAEIEALGWREQDRSLPKGVPGRQQTAQPPPGGLPDPTNREKA